MQLFIEVDHGCVVLVVKNLDGRTRMLEHEKPTIRVLVLVSLLRAFRYQVLVMVLIISIVPFVMVASSTLLPTSSDLIFQLRLRKISLVKEIV